MQFKWSVNKVTVAENDLVVKVGFTVTGTDGDNSAASAYTRNLTRGDTFTPFIELSEQQVLDWCFLPEISTWLDMDNVERSSTRRIKDEGEAQVTGQIERRLAKAACEPALPWITI